MTVVDCDRCGSEFDTDRDHEAGDYADTDRCPYCGKQADGAEEPPVVNGGGSSGGAQFEVTLTIQVDGGEVHVRD